MAYEGVFLEQNNLDKRSVTWGATSSVNRGTVVVLAKDPNTGDIHRARDTIFLGVSTEEKTTSEDNTTITVMTRGDVDMYATGNIALGDLVVLSNEYNHVESAPTSLSGVGLKYIVGRSLETATDEEVVRIRLIGAG